MSAIGNPTLLSSPIVLVVTAAATALSRPLASSTTDATSILSSASSSVSASALPDPANINASDGALAALLAVPLLLLLMLWMIVSKPAIIFHSSQAFLSFLAMCCFASVASFQAKHGVGPSGLSGFAIFISIVGIILPLFMLLVPVFDVKYGRLTHLSRALSEVRVGFILTSTGTALTLLIAFIVTISAWTEPGCKNPDNDPHADLGDDFKNGLSSWCTTKKAGAIFFWLAFAFWTASLVLSIINWRTGKAGGPRDPPFDPPVEGDYDELEEDEESTFGRVPPLRENSSHGDSPFSDSNVAGRQSQSYTLPPINGIGTPSAPLGSGSAAPRQSIDTYGAFSDPAPTGYGGVPPPSSFGAASGLSGSSTPAGVSRTMQYADPYAQVRATLAGATGSAPAPSYSGSTSPVRQGPPSYTDYTGYR